MAKDEKDDVDRRGALECMIWAGTGVLWTMAGGVPRSSVLGISEAKAQPASGFTFLQISDSHIGFKQAPNPNPLATLEEAISKVGALPQTPAFMIHTGDITHLSKSLSSSRLKSTVSRTGVSPEARSHTSVRVAVQGKNRPARICFAFFASTLCPVILRNSP